MPSAAAVAPEPAGLGLTARLSARRTLAPLALVACCLTGCLPGATFDLHFTEPPSYNERIRLDRQGLTGDQATRAVHHGPYRDGEDEASGEERELVSPLYPLLRNGLEEKLVQSQCYWTARAPSQGGDLMVASWELLAPVTRASAYLTCASPRLLGACRFRHPETGEPAEFRDPGEDFEGCPDDPEPGSFDAELWPFPVESFAFGAGKAEGGFFEEDLVAHAQHVRWAVAKDDDPDRRCPGSAARFEPLPAAGPATPVDFWTGEAGCGQVDGLHSLCGVRCTFDPVSDGILQMALPAATAHSVRPNLRVVDDEATLRRVMAGSGADTWSWATGVDGSGDDVRWHENFSPQATVRQARLFQRLPDGREEALELGEEARLLLSATYPAAGGTVAETWSCAGEVGPDGLTVPLLGVEGVNCDGPGLADALAVTPTYALQHLDEAVGPLVQPLTWQVELEQAPLEGAEVVLELQLVAQRRGAALQVTPLVDLGPAVPGDRRGGSARLQNVGGQVMRIDALHLDGADAGDFTFRIPAGRKTVSLPVKLDLDPPGGSESGLRILGEPQVLTLPSLLRLTPSVVVGDDGPQSAGHLRLRPGVDDGKTVEYLGSELTVDGGHLLFEDPGADFTLVAEPGEAHPFTLTAWNAFADRALPFNLLPGQAVEILVHGTPGGYGERTARLVVDGVPVTDPKDRHKVASVLVLEGRTGALLDLFPPTSQHFPTGHPERLSWRRNVLLVNSGDTPGRRSDLAFEGDGADFFALVSQHEGEVEIGPGESEMFTVEYRPACFPLPAIPPGAGPTASWDRRAVLRVSTDVGDLEVPLVGAYGDSCALSP